MASGHPLLPLGGRDLELSAADRQRFADLATQVLDRTLRDFDAFSADRDARSLSGDQAGDLAVDLADGGRWKPLRAQPNAALFAKRRAFVRDDPSDPRLADSAWQAPNVIVGSGWLPGSVADAVFALAWPDLRSFVLNSAYIGRRVDDGAVLARLAGPTPEDPFRFLGLKWFVFSPAPMLKSVVKLRDFVFISATGTFTRETGELVGYDLMQSVELPGLEPAPGIVRGKIVLGSVFRQSGPDRVDVFVKTYADSFGRVLNSLALHGTANALLSYFELHVVARKKKLAWFVARERWLRRQQTDPVAAVVADSRPQQCGDCGRSSRLLRRCSGCEKPLCSKCAQAVRLHAVDRELRVRKIDVHVCGSCVERADALNAAELTRQQQAVDAEAKTESEDTSLSTSSMTSADWRMMERSTSSSGGVDLGSLLDGDDLWTPSSSSSTSGDSSFFGGERRAWQRG